MKGEKTNAIVSGRKADFFFIYGQTRGLLAYPFATRQSEAPSSSGAPPSSPSPTHATIAAAQPDSHILIPQTHSTTAGWCFFGWCCCGACSFKLHLGGILLRSVSEWVPLLVSGSRRK